MLYIQENTSGEIFRFHGFFQKSEMKGGQIRYYPVILVERISNGELFEETDIMNFKFYRPMIGGKCYEGNDDIDVCSNCLNDL